MRKGVAAWLVLVSAGSAGCATDSAPGEVTTAECPAALVSAQGMQAQGMQAQGLQAQGLQAQGFQLQGISAQGVSAQGVSAQGLTAQGLTAQGLTAQGIGPNGNLHGVALRGVTSAEATRWVTGDEPVLDADKVVFIRVDRGVLTGRTARGEALEQDALVGLLLPFMTTAGERAWIAITAVSRHPDASDLPLYALAVDGESLCADPAGGMFVPGIWDESGARHDSVVSGVQSVDTTFSCTAGVIAKCVAWGYRPWSAGADMHQSCTRMARADYCGNGVPHTEEGTLIDLYDTRGIQTPIPDDGMSFEAGWGVDGAVCVRETRYVDSDVSGTRIVPSCWEDLPRCETFAQATTLGAELGNDSSHTPRSFDCRL
jgi:hypothetical protein